MRSNCNPPLPQAFMSEWTSVQYEMCEQTVQTTPATLTGKSVGLLRDDVIALGECAVSQWGANLPIPCE